LNHFTLPLSTMFSLGSFLSLQYKFPRLCSGVPSEGH
jgi:hypothetical protein